MSEEVNHAAEDDAAKTALFEALGVEQEKEEVKDVRVEKTEVQATKEETVSQEVDDDVEEDDGYTDVEREALALGWKPEGVPGRKTKGAEEWMDDYSLYKKINDLGKQVQEKNHLLENVAKHFESVQDAAYKQAKREFDQQVADLRQLAADTLDEGEMTSEDVIAAYENDLKVLQETHNEEVAKLNKKEATKPQTVEDVKASLSDAEKAFVDRHEKLLFSQKSDDIAVQAYVVNRNNELAQEGLSPDDRMVALEKDLANMFPSKFGVTKKVKPKVVSKVESNSVSGRPSKQFSLKNLAPDQKELYDYFVEQGVPAEELLSQFEMIIAEEK